MAVSCNIVLLCVHNPINYWINEDNSLTEFGDIVNKIIVID